MKPHGLTRELPEEGWITEPGVGLYWIRYVNDDGSRTEPVFCLVTPGGPDDEKYAPWAYTPNLPKDHPTWMNYFAGDDKRIEYLPYTEDLSGETLQFELRRKT